LPTILQAFEIITENRTLRANGPAPGETEIPGGAPIQTAKWRTLSPGSSSGSSSIVPATQPRVPVHYTAYGDESDPGPFPIPANAPVEGGASSTGDRHVLVVQQSTCHLFELYDAHWRGSSWDAASGAN